MGRSPAVPLKTNPVSTPLACRVQKCLAPEPKPGEQYHRSEGNRQSPRASWQLKNKTGAASYQHYMNCARCKQWTVNIE